MADNQSPEMTLQQIEEHIDNANLDQFSKQAAHGVAGAQQDLNSVLTQVCGVYRGIKPVLEAVVKFVLTPAKIKEALRKFMGVMDTLCPA